MRSKLETRSCNSGPYIIIRREREAQVIPNYKLKHDTACMRIRMWVLAKITRQWNWFSIVAYVPNPLSLGGRFFGMTLLLLEARAWFAQSNNGTFNSTDYSARPADASLIASLRARREAELTILSSQGLHTSTIRRFVFNVTCVTFNRL